MPLKKIKEVTTIEHQKISAYSNQAHLLSDSAIKYIYLIAGTHGDEPESTYVLNKLIKEDYFANLKYPIILIPEINPDGLKAKTRWNANLVDLNRNFPSSNWEAKYDNPRYFPGAQPNSEIETQFLISLFSQYIPKFIISFHSWKPILNHNHNLQALDLAKLIAKYNNYPLSDYIGYKTPGSLESYIDEKVECGLLTYELPIAHKELTLKKVWLENKSGLQAALEFFKTTYD